MDLQAAENDHKKDKKEPVKSSWACPCSGCSKAVKQERERILQEIEKIDLSNVNSLGMKIMLQEILGVKKK